MTSNYDMNQLGRSWGLKKRLVLSKPPVDSILDKK
jgi:hypothetical protein